MMMMMDDDDDYNGCDDGEFCGCVVMVTKHVAWLW